jgi:NTE family protein
LILVDFWRSLMQMNKTGTRALVLGGGGVAGVAWELGIITGLYEKGVDVRTADIIIGTSAGSVVGAQITSGTDLESLFASQLTPAEQSKERRVEFDPARLMDAFSQAVAEVGSDIKAIRARIGAYALTAPTVPEAERRAIIESRLPSRTWPQQRLLIVAVDTATGEEYIMDRESGVPLVDAVAASCAVPGVWPPVTIAGRRYMDGGMRSATNADLASGYDRVLILNPLGANADYMGMGLTAEVAALEREGSRVLVIAPDTASVAAIGLNPLDPATRQPSALAGRAQGHELANSVAALWSHA